MHSTDTRESLTDCEVSVTGRLASMTHEQFAELVATLGGRFVREAGEHTRLLVIGAEGWPLKRDGAPTGNLDRAKALVATGRPLEIVEEDEFFHRYGPHDAAPGIHRRYTIAQLARILELHPARINAWVKAGLLKPVDVQHRLAYFDFQHVTGARMIDELMRQGVSPARIRDSLEQLRRWLPSVEQPLAQLSLVGEGRRLLVRLEGGRLAEASGQLRLDYEPQDEAPDALRMPGPSTVDEWFEKALDFEEQGQFADAAHAYREAISLEPGDPQLHFNLGNTLFAAGELAESRAEFEQAIRHDVMYAEAWNNLGSVLAELDDYPASEKALRQAVNLVPDFADARYNLAQTLWDSGRRTEAVEHLAAFLQLDPDSPWALDARRQLEELR